MSLHCEYDPASSLAGQTQESIQRGPGGKNIPSECNPVVTIVGWPMAVKTGQTQEAMTSHHHRLLSIDEAYLLRKFPDLALLLRRGYPPDEVGQAWLNRARRAAPRQQSQRRQTGAEEDLEQAKAVLHQVLHTDNPDFQVIRGILFARPDVKTPVLVSTLSLWLAGHLGLSLGMVTPLVAVMLYEISTGKGGTLETAG